MIFFSFFLGKPFFWYANMRPRIFFRAKAKSWITMLPFSLWKVNAFSAVLKRRLYQVSQKIFFLQSYTKKFTEFQNLKIRALHIPFKHSLLKRECLKSIFGAVFCSKDLINFKNIFFLSITVLFGNKKESWRSLCASSLVFKGKQNYRQLAGKHELFAWQKLYEMDKRSDL